MKFIQFKKLTLFTFLIIILGFLSFFSQRSAHAVLQCTSIDPFSANPLEETVYVGSPVDVITLTKFQNGLCSGPFTWTYPDVPTQLTATIHPACSIAASLCTSGDQNTDDAVEF